MPNNKYVLYLLANKNYLGLVLATGIFFSFSANACSSWGLPSGTNPRTPQGPPPNKASGDRRKRTLNFE